MSSSLSSGTFRALVRERNSVCMAWSVQSIGLIAGAASRVEMRIGQQFAVAHPQEQRAAGFSGKLPEPMKRDEGRFGGRL